MNYSHRTWVYHACEQLNSQRYNYMWKIDCKFGNGLHFIIATLTLGTGPVHYLVCSIFPYIFLYMQHIFTKKNYDVNIFDNVSKARTAIISLPLSLSFSPYIYILPIESNKIVTWGAFYIDGLTLTPHCLSNRMHNKGSGEITQPFPKFNGLPLKFGNG